MPTPDLEMEIQPLIFSRTFRVNFHEQILGRNDPRFIFSKYILPVLAEDFEVFIRKHLGKTLVEFGQIGVLRFLASGQLL